MMVVVDGIWPLVLSVADSSFVVALHSWWGDIHTNRIPKSKSSGSGIGIGIGNDMYDNPRCCNDLILAALPRGGVFSICVLEGFLNVRYRPLAIETEPLVDKFNPGLTLLVRRSPFLEI
jgi:hypothetical protein